MKTFLKKLNWLPIFIGICVLGISGALLQQKYFAHVADASYLETNLQTTHWVKYTKTYTDFATNGTSNTVTIFTLPIKGIVHAIAINPTVTFSGGTLAVYRISLGIGGNTTKYASNANVFTGATYAALGNNLESVSATTDVIATISSVGDNLDQATQGSVDIYFLVSTLQ